jgi:hypothetical protein
MKSIYRDYVDDHMSDANAHAALFAGKADLVHTHSMTHISGLVDALGGKAALVHSHTLEDISDFDDGILDSARYASSAGGLVEGVVVDSATNASYASSAGALVYGDETKTAAELLTMASSSTVSSASSATKLKYGNSYKTASELLTLASSNTVTYGTSATYLDGATKQQVIDSAVASAGGGGMQFPDYANLTGNAYNTVYRSTGLNSGVYYSTTNLSSGSKYYAMDNGYMRVSIKNASATGLDCLRCSIGGVEIALFDVQSAGGGGSGCLRGATQILPISSGADFKVYSLSGNWVGEVLVKFDHSVSTTPPPFNYTYVSSGYPD